MGFKLPWTMKLFPNRNYLLVVILQLWLSVHLILSSSVSGVSGSSKDLLTPIPRWQESWTASQAHGTAMAMTVHDCLVMFLRSPSTDVYKPTFTPAADVDVIELDGLRVERINAEQQHASMQYAPSWLPIGSHTLCAMTGLAMDVEHICRVLQKKIDDHLFVYQTSMTTHAMTQKVASVLQNECLLKGSRPYGIQCILVGCDDIDPRDGGLCIYSIDPTGTWQSWGRATAIGKFGTDVRRILAKKLQSSPSITDVGGAVECLLGSWKETCKDLGISNNEEEDCEVLILQKDSKRSQKSCLFRVSAEEVDRIMGRVDSAIFADSL